MSPDDVPERTDSLNSYPQGMPWRCLRCDYVCDGDGPDRCPHDGAPLVRLMGVLTFGDVERNKP